MFMTPRSVTQCYYQIQFIPGDYGHLHTSPFRIGLLQD